MKHLFYERVNPACYTRWWHGRAYFDYMRNRLVMVVFPFNYAVAFAWWINCKWCRLRHRNSWIDEQINAVRAQYEKDL